MDFVPYHELGDRPNVIVDGAPNPHTVLTLSHWPHSGTPAEFVDDLSAQIAFRYLDDPGGHPSAPYVSNNHFDEDGLVSLFVLVEPDAARQRRDLLVDVARAGDFGAWHHRDAARIAMAITACADPAASPLAPELFEGSYATQTGALYAEMLGRLAELCDHPGRFRHLWGEEDAHLEASLAGLADGRITIEEVPELDLAVVDVSGFAHQPHPMALHHATDMFRVLTTTGERHRLTYRYETWVQYRSREVLPRVDLAPLAAQLDDEERAGARWRADRVDHIVPALRLADPEATSTVSPARFRDLVQEHLASAPPAWNPYDA